MRKLYAAFEGDHQSALAESGQDQEILARYEGAKMSGALNGRPVSAMWVIDERDDVIRTHGSVPGDIDARHAAWREGPKRNEPPAA